MARTKDDRRIVKGVQLPVVPRDEDGEPLRDDRDRPRRASTFLTFGPGDEDEFEAHATPEQVEHLRRQGVVEGKGWKPASGHPKAVKAVADAKEAERIEAEATPETEATPEPEKKPAHAAHPTHHAAKKE